MLGVLFFDTLPGLFIGIAVSLLLLLYRASKPNVACSGCPAPHAVRRSRSAPRERAPARCRRGAGRERSLLRQCRHVRETVQLAGAPAPGTRAVVLDMETVPGAPDVSAVRMLAEVRVDLEREGVQLLFARDIGQVRDVLRRADDEGLTQRIYPTVEAAVEAAKAGGPPPRAS